MGSCKTRHPKIKPLFEKILEELESEGTKNSRDNIILHYYCITAPLVNREASDETVRFLYHTRTREFLRSWESMDALAAS